MLFTDLVVDEVRNQFPLITSEEQADYFIEELKTNTSQIAKGYTAAMIFMKSRYVVFPLTKLKYFKQGKNLLDKTIVESPKNIELRYIRFLMQKQIPDFLGYNQYINQDFNVFINGFETCNLNTEIKIEMINNMLLVNNLTAKEKEKLNKLLKTI
jgi:hypothetical protein